MRDNIKPTPLKQVSLFLDPAQYDALKALSLNTNSTQQFYLRKGLKYILAKHKAQVAR